MSLTITNPSTSPSSYLNDALRVIPTTTVNGPLVVKGSATFTFQEPGEGIDLNTLITILLCPIKDLSLFLLSEKKMERQYAERRFAQFNSDFEEFKKAMEK